MISCTINQITFNFCPSASLVSPIIFFRRYENLCDFNLSRGRHSNLSCEVASAIVEGAVGKRWTLLLPKLNYIQTWAESLSPGRGRGVRVLDQYFGVGGPLRIWNNLHSIILSRTEDKMNAVNLVLMPVISHSNWEKLRYSHCFCILGAQTNFIKQINSIVQLIPCLHFGQTHTNWNYIPYYFGRTREKLYVLGQRGQKPYPVSRHIPV